MVLWTIQPIEVYEKLMKNGTYHCDGRYTDKYFRPSYRWLVKKMEEKIGKAPKGVTYPIWAWHTRDWKRKKPDLRSAEYGYKGEKMVCMEIDIPDNKVVLSDFDNWHSVLNKWYLNLECDDEETFDREHEWLKSLSEEERKRVIEKSWDNIFIITPKNNNWWSRGKWIQATFWELRKENIKKVQFFVAR